MGCVPSTENGTMRRPKTVNHPAPLCGGSVSRSADLRSYSCHSSHSRARSSESGTDFGFQSNPGLPRISSKPRLCIVTESESRNPLQLKHNKWPDSLNSITSYNPSTDGSRIRLNLRSSSYVKAVDERLLRIGKLGRGGSASVFLTVDYITLKLVAKKVISTKSHRLINHEVAALRSQRTPLLSETFVNDPSLNFCPFISRFYGCNVNNMEGKASIAMEYECCGSLEDWAKDGLPTPEPWLAHVAYSVLKALHFIHSDLNQVHRDVKPGNILLNDSTVNSMLVKLADFGTAVRAASSRKILRGNDVTIDEEREVKCFAQHNMPMSPTGTQRYMAPERLASDGYTFNSDIWSVGLTLATAANKGECPLPHTANEFDQIGVAMKADVAILGREILDEESPSSFPSSRVSYVDDSDAGIWENDLSNTNTLLSPDFKPSAEFRDFLRLCLRSNYLKRPDAASMLSHPFLMTRAGWEEQCPEVLAAAQKRRESNVSRENTQKIIDAIVIARLKAEVADPISTKNRPKGFNEFSREFCLDPDELAAEFEKAALNIDREIDEEIHFQQQMLNSRCSKAEMLRKTHSGPQFPSAWKLATSSSYTVAGASPLASLRREETIGSVSEAETSSLASDRIRNQLQKLRENPIGSMSDLNKDLLNHAEKAAPSPFEECGENGSSNSSTSQSDLWKSSDIFHQKSCSANTVHENGPVHEEQVEAFDSIDSKRNRFRKPTVWRVNSSDSEKSFKLQQPTIEFNVHKRTPTLASTATQ